MKRFFLFLMLFFAGFSSHSQFFMEVVNMGKSFIDTPENIDTNYVYQLPARFCFALTGVTQMTGFFAYADFKILNTIEAQSLSYLGERLCKKVGFEAGYGSVSFGYDFELGQRSAQYKRSLSLGMSNLKWGVRFSYSGVQNNIISSLTIGKPDEVIYTDTIETSEGLGKLRSFAVDGYYVFNNKRFGYTATNTINVVQKHTSGSFLLAGRFLWSDLDTKEDMNGLFESYATTQLALGGGYSANIVLWNRDIVNNDDRTIRNLTFNITATPLLSFVNYMQTRSYYVELFENDDSRETLQKSDVWCYPSLNFIGSSALSMTWGRFYFTGQFQYSIFHFSSSGAVNDGTFQAPNMAIEGYDGDILNDVNLHGFLYNWSLSAKLFYRF